MEACLSIPNNIIGLVDHILSLLKLGFSLLATCSLGHDMGLGAVDHLASGVHDFKRFLDEVTPQLLSLLLHRLLVLLINIVSDRLNCLLDLALEAAEVDAFGGHLIERSVLHGVLVGGALGEYLLERLREEVLNFGGSGCLRGRFRLRLGFDLGGGGGFCLNLGLSLGGCGVDDHAARAVLVT